MRHRTQITCLAACVAMLTAAPDVTAQGLVPTDDQVREMVDTIAARTLEKSGTVGFSIAIARGQSLIYANGFGLADVENDVPANAETLFRIGPLTRVFTAAAIMRFAEEDLINIDESINNFLPEFNTQGNHVTVRNLLAQTSGMKAYTELDKWFEQKSLDVTGEEMVALFQDEPYFSDPGRYFNYNNSGYYLLGLIIEKVSGRPYAQYMQEEFFTPLVMERTRIDSNSALIPNRAQGYAYSGGQFYNDEHFSMTQISAAGAILSTANELVEWQIALFNGTVLNQDSVDTMTKSDILNDGRDSEHGFGMKIGSRFERTVYEQTGNIFGFDGTLLYFPDDKLHVAVLSNCQNISSMRLAVYVAQAAMGEEVPILAAKPVGDQDFTRFAGWYKNEVPAAQIEFQLGEDGNLYIPTRTAAPIQLMYMGGSTFLYGDESVSITFNIDVADPAGKAASVTITNAGQTLTAQRIR